MTLLTSILDTYFTAEEDEVAIEELQTVLSVDTARELQAEWRRVLARHDPDECYGLVVDHACRGASDGEAAWRWLNARYQQLEDFFQKAHKFDQP